MKPKRLVTVAIAVGLGSVAMLLMRQYVGQKERALEKLRREIMKNYTNPLQVLVAVKDLPEQTAIEPAHLRLVEVPEKFIQPYATRNASDLLGKVTLAPVAEGEQVMLNKVREAEEFEAATTLSGVTPEGKRAVTIGLDLITGVGKFVLPGDMVDILWTFKLPADPATGRKEEELVTMTLFQNVKVLAIDRHLEGAADKEKGDATSEFTGTLALTPEEASLLLFAREQGRIQLSLRSRRETAEQVPVPPANMATILEATLGPDVIGKEQGPRPASRSVEVIKGLERTVVAINE